MSMPGITYVKAHPEVEASSDGRPERYVARERTPSVSVSGSSRRSSTPATRTTRRGRPIAAFRWSCSNRHNA